MSCRALTQTTISSHRRPVNSDAFSVIVLDDSIHVRRGKTRRTHLDDKLAIDSPVLSVKSDNKRVFEATFSNETMLLQGFMENGG